MGGLKKIIMHWTAGSWTPNETDKEHYHFLVTGAPNVITGKYQPEDNISCNDGKYAAHCGGGNTSAIGISLCGMAGFDIKNKQTPYPLREKQFQRACYLAAQLCQKYKIPVENVMTHMEFGNSHPSTTSHGKIDICYLPFKPELKPNEIGGYIRNEIREFMPKTKVQHG